MSLACDRRGQAIEADILSKACSSIVLLTIAGRYLAAALRRATHYNDAGAQCDRRLSEELKEHEEEQ